jgi:O-antigen/teichoic acid export membrane protein
VNKGLSLAMSLVSVPIFLSFMDQTRYGIWVTIYTLVNWIGFFDIGISQGVRNKLAESIAKNNHEDGKKYVSTAYISICLIFIFIILTFLLISLFVDWSFLVNPPHELAKEVNLLIILTICFMSINFIVRIFNSILLAMQMPSVYSFSDLIAQAIILAMIFIISKSHLPKSLILLGLIITIVPSLVTLIFSIVYFKNKFKNIAPSFKYFKKSYIGSILKLGSSFFFIQIFLIILSQSNNIIISNVNSPDKVAEYYIAFRYISVLLMGFTIITTPLWSATTDAYIKNDFTWIRQITRKMMILLLVFVLVGLIMVLFSNTAFKIWINNKIPISSSLLMLILVYVVIQMIWSIYASVINGMGKIRLQLYSTFISAMIHIPLAFFLGRKFGVNGVVISLIICTSLLFAWAPIQYRKLLNGTASGIWNK